MAILVSPEERRAVRANWYLAALIFFLSLRLIIRFLFRTGYLESSNPLTIIGLSSDLFLGPCLYFYILLLTRARQPKGWRFLGHWIPGTAGILVSLWMFLSLQSDATAFSDYRSQAPKLGFIVWHLPFLVSVLAYSTISLVLLQHHGKQIKERFSNLSQINLTWLRWLCGFLILASIGAPSIWSSKSVRRRVLAD